METVAPRPDPAVPLGAEADEWIDNQREIYRGIGHVPVSSDLILCPMVTVSAEQFRNGRIGCVDIILDVELGMSHAGLSAESARELAALLLNGAAIADEWVGRTPRPPVLDRLAEAFAVLHGVLVDLRDDRDRSVSACVVTALDGVVDARAAFGGSR